MGGGASKKKRDDAKKEELKRAEQKRESVVNASKVSESSSESTSKAGPGVSPGDQQRNTREKSSDEREAFADFLQVRNHSANLQHSLSCEQHQLTYHSFASSRCPINRPLTPGMRHAARRWLAAAARGRDGERLGQSRPLASHLCQVLLPVPGPRRRRPAPSLRLAIFLDLATARF
jgi:hypothetical protein